MSDESVRLERTLTALLLSSLRTLGQKEQVALLDKAGFGPKEIAGFLGSTPKAISVRLAEIRKKAKATRNKK